MIKLEVFNNNSRGVYHGISRQYFPRWEGWQMIEEGKPKEFMLEAVEQFYMTYFYYPLKLDLLEDKDLAMACLNFAASEGKKKLISKLQKATSSHLEGTKLIEAVGGCDKYRLLLEFLDHYYWLGKPTEGLWVINTYRNI